MARYAVETRSTEPKNFFAGDFPTLPETGTAGEKLAEHTPVSNHGGCGRSYGRSGRKGRTRCILHDG